MQTWLNGVRDACTWYDPLKADGRFGLFTENAVKEFQLKNKMNVDGKVGANTWNVLYTQYTAKHGLNVPYPGIVLRSGASGGTVRLVQQKLNSLGERLNADGRYGAATAAPCSGSSAATALPPTAASVRHLGKAVLTGKRTIGNALRFALGKFRGKNSFYSGFSENLRIFRKPFFTGRGRD